MQQMWLYSKFLCLQDGDWNTEHFIMLTSQCNVAQFTTQLSIIQFNCSMLLGTAAQCVEQSNTCYYEKVDFIQQTHVQNSETISAAINYSPVRINF